jgi:hypothetical protein
MPHPPRIVHSATFVFHIDIVIVAILAVFALYSLPLALARLTRAAEWTNGHIIRSVRLNPPRSRRAKAPMLSDRWKELRILHSDDSHTVASYAYLGKRQAAKVSGMSLPPHVAAWPVGPRLVAALQRRLIPGFSFGQMLILLGYSGIMLYTSFLHSTPFADPVRVGYIAVSQIPIAFAFATKNNLAGMLLGRGYEKVTFACSDSQYIYIAHTIPSS